MKRIEDKLKAKAHKAKKEYAEQPRKINDIFTRAGTILPQNLHTTNYYDRTPIAAFNPGASEVYSTGKIDIYPRLHYDAIYDQSPGVIGKFQMDLDAILNKCRMSDHIPTEIVISPEAPWEIHGCEDARIYESNGERYVLYTGWGISDGEKKSVLVLSYDGEKYYFQIGDRSMTEYYIPFSNKDAAILNIDSGGKMNMLTRLHLGDGDQFCWSCESHTTYDIFDESLDVQLMPNSHEDRIGWSTNAIKLNKNEYLVGYHATLKRNWEYVNGLAIVDEMGNLKAISDYLLAPRGIKEWVGNRYGVIFGCGLVVYRGYLIWIGGISDWAIGFFVSRLDLALSELIYI